MRLQFPEVQEISQNRDSMLLQNVRKYMPSARRKFQKDFKNFTFSSDEIM